MSETNEDNIDLALFMDSTGIPEFKIVDNTNYSSEIILAARAIYNLELLEDLKVKSNLSEFYTEVKEQIHSQWHADQALNVHTDMFRVEFQIKVGNILNIVEPTFKKKSDYTKWVKDNFATNHIRYFQQAKQLADMGDFAETYAAAGKNRLLDLEHIRKVEKKRECEMLFEKYPLPDTTKDNDGQLLKRHIDSVITLHRLQNAGIRFATINQSALVASFDNEALGVKKTDDIAKWLNQYPEDQRPKLFNQFIQDQLTYPSDHPYTPAPKASLEKVLTDLLNSYGKEKLEDGEWIKLQRELKVMDSLLAAQELIAQLIKRIGVEAPAAEVPTETATTVTAF